MKTRVSSDILTLAGRESVENEGKGRGRYDASTCFMVQYKMSAKNTGSKYISCTNTWRFLLCADLNLWNVQCFIYLVCLHTYIHTHTHTHTHTHEHIFCIVSLYLVCLYLFLTVFVHARYNVVPPPPQHKTIPHNAKEIIANVTQTCNEETRQKQLLVLISQAMESGVTYKGKSWSTILRIQGQHRESNATNPDQLLKSSGKKRQKGNLKVVWVCVCCGQLWQVFQKHNPQFL